MTVSARGLVASTLPIATTLPQPRSAMGGTSARASRKSEVKLTER
jgi:hypothetical protein